MDDSDDGKGFEERLASLEWLAPTRDDRGEWHLPAGAVSSGFSEEYVARADHAGSLVVGFAVKSGTRIRALLPYAGKTHCKYWPETPDLEILTNRGRDTLLAWLPCERGAVPSWAVPGGRDMVSQEVYYIGRVPDGGGHRKIGKVHPGRGAENNCLYYALGDKEASVRKYEVLTILRD